MNEGFICAIDITTNKRVLLKQDEQTKLYVADSQG
jgi:hypothetical protein